VPSTPAVPFEEPSMSVFRALIPYVTDGAPANAPPHYATIQVEAEDETEARRLAIAEFETAARLATTNRARLYGTEFTISLAPFADGMSFDTELVVRDAKTAVLHLRGTLTGDNYTRLQDALANAKSKGVAVLVVELGGLSFVNSTGLATLIHAGADFEVRMAAIPARIGRLLKMVGATVLFKSYLSADEAAAAGTT
jgi:anti-sigma B factor antagonist